MLRAAGRSRGEVFRRSWRKFAPAGPRPARLDGESMEANPGSAWATRHGVPRGPGIRPHISLQLLLLGYRFPALLEQLEERVGVLFRGFRGLAGKSCRGGRTFAVSCG